MKDELFKTQNIATFSFDAQVAAVFDDMLARSIPFYPQLVDMLSDFILNFLFSDKNQNTNDIIRIIDFGCSTGNLLLKIALKSREKNRKLQLIGIDNSPDMIERAKLKSKALGVDVNFICADMLDYMLDSKSVDCFICNYVLQFLTPDSRYPLLRRLYEALKPNAILILSEKVKSNHNRINITMIDEYHKYKQSQGYTLGEIAKKRDSLENVLIPNTSDENLHILRKANFAYLQIIFAWLNFETILALKED